MAFLIKFIRTVRKLVLFCLMFLSVVLIIVLSQSNGAMPWKFIYQKIKHHLTPISRISDPSHCLISRDRLFFSLISIRLESHIKFKNNKFINSSFQNGCMENVPGCWEHMSMVWSAMKEARSNQTDLTTIWLDVANAYGSIPHKLIFFALERY